MARDELILIENRAKELFCNVLLNYHEDIQLVQLAKLPGLHLGTSIRNHNDEKEISPKEFRHCVGTCSNFLMRKLYEDYFGTVIAQLTFYQNYIRYAIPIPEPNHHLISIINMGQNSDTFYHKNDKHSFINFRQILERFTGKRYEYYHNTNEKPSFINFENPENCSHLSKPLIIILKEIFEFRKKHLNFGTDSHPFTNDDLMSLKSRIGTSSGELIRYCQILEIPGYEIGVPYIRANTELLVPAADRSRRHIETCMRHMQRERNFEQTGGVQFTLVLYKKIARMTIPINENFLVSISIDYWNSQKQNFSNLNADDTTVPEFTKKILTKINKFDEKIYNKFEL